jgi:hypothetical protein
MKKTIAAGAIAAVIILIIALYFYFSPVFIQPRKFSLDSARNYYTVLSSFVALLGIVLGFLYYIHKLGVDRKGAEQERKRQNLDYLIRELKTYDELVDEIIHFRFSNCDELEKIRGKISRSYETIILMLMHKTKLLGLNDNEAQTILRVHSFVEQNDILMKEQFDNLTKEKTLSVKSAYVDLFQEARKTCFEKIC